MKNFRIPPMLLAVVFGFSLLASPAYAGCLTECLAAQPCQPNSGSQRNFNLNTQCLQDKEACAEQCGTSLDAVSYGAIASGADGMAWGMSNPFFSEEKGAIEEAVGFCGQHGKGCQPVLVASNACMAITSSSAGNPVMAWGQGVTQKQAQDDAMAECTKKNGSSCVVRLWNCYLP